MQETNTFIHDGESEYVVRVVKPRYRWLWLALLLLLPLLLLLRFDKNVRVLTIDSDTKNAVKDVNVDFEYVDYSLIKTNPFRFFATDTIKVSGKTSQDGFYTFTDVNYSLYQVIFHPGSEAEITAGEACRFSDTLHPLFRKLNEPIAYEIPLSEGVLDVVFRAVDSDDGQPLSGASVEVILDGNVKNLLTDAQGYVTLNGLKVCGNINLNAQMDGYTGDTIISDMATVLRNEDNRTLRLVPGHGVVSFTVKDLDNHQPIPNVTASLIINGDTILFTTNTNGVGKGAFEEVCVSHPFEIEFRKIGYHDTLTQKYKVTEFERLSESERTFYMRPEKNSMVFRNIDSLTQKPIAGVKNEVFINGKLIGEIVSNNQGCFTIGNLGENDVIKIKSSHVSYKLKVVNKKGKDVIGDNQHKRDIPMMKNTFKVGKPDPSRHCGVHFSGTLLSDEKVGSHISKIYKPDMYGEYVGDGRYPSNQMAFPKAVQYTFDAIAIDKGTHLKIYSKPNFQGELLLDVSGPCLINNVKWKDDSRIRDFLTKQFSPELEANYPPSCRRWSDTDMNAWDFGSSIITCDEK